MRSEEDEWLAELDEEPLNDDFFPQGSGEIVYSSVTPRPPPPHPLEWLTYGSDSIAQILEERTNHPLMGDRLKAALDKVRDNDELQEHNIPWKIDEFLEVTEHMQELAFNYVDRPNLEAGLSMLSATQPDIEQLPEAAQRAYQILNSFKSWTVITALEPWSEAKGYTRATLRTVIPGLMEHEFPLTLSFIYNEQTKEILKREDIVENLARNAANEKVPWRYGYQQAYGIEVLCGEHNDDLAGALRIFFRDITFKGLQEREDASHDRLERGVMDLYVPLDEEEKHPLDDSVWHQKYAHYRRAENSPAKRPQNLNKCAHLSIP